MRIAVVIPSRLSATRLPQKPLADIQGTPMIVWVWRQAQKAIGIDELVVATDHEDIANVVKFHGGKVVMTRPDHQSGSDRVAEAAEKLGVDAAINVQGDEPFVHPQDISDIANCLRQPACEMATLVHPIQNFEEFQNPNIVKVVMKNNQEALYFSRSPIPYDRHNTKNLEHLYRHIGIYGYNLKVLLQLSQTPPHPLELRESLEQLRALANGVGIRIIFGKTTGRGIDTPDDLTWARKRVETLGNAAFPNCR